jgi:hypothetical protein
MKKCTYCGKEFPDEAKACDIDGTPLDAPPPVLQDSSSGRASPGATVPDVNKSKVYRNLKAISILYIIFGSIFSLSGVRFGLDFIKDPDTLKLMLRDDIETFVFLILFWVGGLFSLVSAIGFLRRRKWGMIGCLICSCFYLIAFPIGTLLGGYYIVKHRDIKDMFS